MGQMERSMYVALGTSSQGWGVVSKRPDGDASQGGQDWIVAGCSIQEPRRKHSGGLRLQRKKREKGLQWGLAVRQESLVTLLQGQEKTCCRVTSQLSDTDMDLV